MAVEAVPFHVTHLEAFPEGLDGLRALGVDLDTVRPLYAVTFQRDGAPVACAGVTAVLPWVAEAWVLAHPLGWRERGVVVAMVQHDLLTWLATGPCHRVQATVRVDRRGICNLLRRLGFTDEGCLRRFDVDGTDHTMYALTREPT